jgi:hypothetical protein
MVRLLVGVVDRGKEPRFAGDEQPAQFGQGCQRDLGGTNHNACAVDRVELPGRQNGYDAGRQLHVHEVTRCTSLALNLSGALPVQRMPTILDDDIQPDMGRMDA